MPRISIAFFADCPVCRPAPIARRRASTRRARRHRSRPGHDHVLSPAAELTNAPEESQSRAPVMAGGRMSAIKRRSQISILAALAFGALQLAGPASAASASAFCSSGAAPDVPIPVPQDLEADVAKTFDIPVEMVRDGAFV